MQIGDLNIRNRYDPEAPLVLEKNGYLRLRGEVPWLVEGPKDQLTKIQGSLDSVAQKLSSTLIQLDFGNSLGLLKVPYLGWVNVVTAKWTERDFDKMLADLTEIAGGLPYTAGSVTSLPYDRSVISRQDILYHMFAYLRYIMTTADPTEQLLPQLRVLLSDPHRRLEEYRKEVPIALLRRVSTRTLDSVLTGTDNLCHVGPSVSARIPLARILNNSLPEFVVETQHRMTFDTPENRFIKSFLSIAVGIADKMEEAVKKNQKPIFAARIRSDCRQIKQSLKPIQQHSLWRDVGEMIHFPASSTVLQRRRGYKEVFHHFSKLRLATRVPIPQAIIQRLLETKRIDKLYEYWCYFSVCRELEKDFGPPLKSSTVAFKETEILVKGEFCVEWSSGMKVFYNPSFSRLNKLEGRKTYSTCLRPDIAIETAKGDLHLLDAKFKLDKFDSIINSDDEDSSEVDEHLGKFKKADLYKMHTYRDAIPRAKSVWVLYPGSEFCFFEIEGIKLNCPKDLTESSEGVGAIPFLPGSTSDFVRQVLSKLITSEGLDEKVSL